MEMSGNVLREPGRSWEGQGRWAPAQLWQSEVGGWGQLWEPWDRMCDYYPPQHRPLLPLHRVPVFYDIPSVSPAKLKTVAPVLSPVGSTVCAQSSRCVRRVAGAR